MPINTKISFYLTCIVCAQRIVIQSNLISTKLFFPKLLSYLLEKEGYAVSFYLTLKQDLFDILKTLQNNATNSSKNIICISCHGNGEEREHGYSSKLHLSNGNLITDKELIENVMAIPGETALMIDACRGEGFCTAAKRKSPNNLLVFTSSQKNDTKTLNSFALYLIHIVLNNLALSKSLREIPKKIFRTNIPGKLFFRKKMSKFKI